MSLDIWGKGTHNGIKKYKKQKKHEKESAAENFMIHGKPRKKPRGKYVM